MAAPSACAAAAAAAAPGADMRGRGCARKSLLVASACGAVLSASITAGAGAGSPAGAAGRQRKPAPRDGPAGRPKVPSELQQRRLVALTPPRAASPHTSYPGPGESWPCRTCRRLGPASASAKQAQAFAWHGA